jgi:hypothetical protein
VPNENTVVLLAVLVTYNTGNFFANSSSKFMILSPVGVVRKYETV